MLNGYIARKKSIRHQELFIKKHINYSIRKGGTSVTLIFPSSGIYQEVLDKVFKKGYDIFMIPNSFEESIEIRISWKDGKKKNGILCFIDENTLLETMDLHDDYHYSDDSNSEDFPDNN